MSQPFAHKSEWTFEQKVRRALWMIVQASLFRFSWHNFYEWRNVLLRCFGARVGKSVRVRPTVRVEIPWNVTIDDGVVIGDFVTLYSLGPISIGRATVISQHCYVCAGSHDHTKRSFDLLRPPVAIGAECWLAADVFVGPGVTVGDRTVVGARSSVFGNLPPDVVAAGYPAKVLKARELQG